MALFGQEGSSDIGFSRQIERFRSGLNSAEDLEKEFHRLSKIVNSFLAEKYGVHYKFTYEDLKFELREKGFSDDMWAKIGGLCDLMDKLEFEKDMISRESLMDAAKRLAGLVMSKEIPETKFSPADLLPEPPQLAEEVHKAPAIEKEMPELPKFEPPPLKERITGVIKKLKKNRKELDKGLEMIEKEKKIVGQEKKLIKSELKDLPEFKLFNKTLEDEVRELETKKQILKRKEEFILKHIEELTGLQKQTSDQSKQVKEGHISLNKKKDYVETKEKLIAGIKEDLEAKYAETLEEIEKIKTELKEKRASFTKLQKFYRERESRLAMEEENLLNEKRRYAKTISRLIKEHLEIAAGDLLLTQAKIEELKKRCDEADRKIMEYSDKYRSMARRKADLEEATEKRKNFFISLEKEMRSKDAEYASIKKAIDDRRDQLLKLEKKLSVFESGLEELKKRSKNKKVELDMRELDLKATESEIGRIRAGIRASEHSLEIKAREMKKRSDSFVEMETKIKNDIAREKRAVRKTEEELEKQGYAVSRKLKKFEIMENYYDKAAKVALERQDDAHEEGGRIEREIKITHEFPKRELGSPDVLDILESLKRAKSLIRKNSMEEAREIYVEIQKLFDRLDYRDRDELYRKMIQVFNSTSPQDLSSEDIDTLIEEFRDSVSRGDMRTTADIYPKIQYKYASLPQEEKGKYYSQIMELQQKIA
ncbi:TPA: hypothetical protein HA239_05375 [Candidatus Woesearchaeota archaeon]|nr:hypothetical protein QT06_C0001G0264 [archaeon GW2011_AR15]MBS3103937.1 hypothetical protein [Candidatus Woesearchaeota archaeon]HIH41813.1 hypothetical protein [Candidatus Woesearchaeota archaeon]